MRNALIAAAISAIAFVWPGLSRAESLISDTSPPSSGIERSEPSPCANTRDEDNCAQILACVGDDGLWFRGRALGWNEGILAGRLSDGTACEGEWGRDGWFGRSVGASLSCADGRTGTFRYTAQDPLTGTGIAEGRMSDGREVTAWTGKNVLDYLTPEGERHALLPCGPTAIPIS